MDDVKRYWRDQIDTLLKSGAAVVVLFAGWATKYHGEFSLAESDAAGASDRWAAAVGLLIAATGFALWLPLSVWIIHRSFLRFDVDRTVLPERVSVGFAIVLALTALAIATAMSAR